MKHKTVAGRGTVMNRKCKMCQGKGWVTMGDEVGEDDFVNPEDAPRWGEVFECPECGGDGMRAAGGG